MAVPALAKLPLRILSAIAFTAGATGALALTASPAAAQASKRPAPTSKPAAAAAAPASPTAPQAGGAPSPDPSLAPSLDASLNPADAAFQRGMAALGARCDRLRAAYAAADRRPALVRELADCYLLDADLWRAEAMRADADRLATAPPAPEPPGAIDLAQVRKDLLEACRDFERSLELEPSPGAQIAVALCRLRQDKPAAGRQLLEGMLPQMIARAGTGDPFDRNRLELVQALLKEVARSQPRLTLRVTKTPAPELSVDGEPVIANQPHSLDAGTYRVLARRPNASAETTVTLTPRGSYTLSLDELAAPRQDHWRLATWSLGGAAAASALIGAGAWAYAHSRLGDFESAGGVEGDQLLCPAGPARADCLSAADDVNTWRTVRTTGLVAAGALGVAAVLVHFATPSPRPDELRWMPAVDREQLSLVVQGGF